MNEKTFGTERNPLEELSQGDEKRVEQGVGTYLEEHPGLSEVADGDIDEILTRLIETGPELPPDVRGSLRKAVQFVLGDRLSAKQQEKE